MAVYGRAKKLADAIETVVSESAARRVLEGLRLPSAGTTARSKARWVRQVIERMDRDLPAAQRREIRTCCSCRVTDKMVRTHRKYWRDADGDLAAYAGKVRGGGWKSMKHTGGRTLEYSYDFKDCICGLARGTDEPISHTFCLCTAGHCERFFEAVFGVPARVTILKTHLRDGENCSFRVRLARKPKR